MSLNCNFICKKYLIRNSETIDVLKKSLKEIKVTFHMLSCRNLTLKLASYYLNNFLKKINFQLKKNKKEIKFILSYKNIIHRFISRNGVGMKILEGN